MAVKKLPPEKFAFIVENGILSSIDLIVANSHGKILLGERKNKPAQGYLFVPGGVVLHGERWGEALKRISLEEIGIALRRQDVKFVGIHEQLYEDNFTGNGFSTHYHSKAVSHNLNALDLPNPNAFNDQHNIYLWLSQNELLVDPRVHEYTKNYFIPNAPTRLDI